MSNIISFDDTIVDSSQITHRQQNPQEQEQPAIDIQPLRDLARNFDIDIEPYLEEYLRQTTHGDDNDDDDNHTGNHSYNDGTRNSTDDNGQSSRPNFAQAALKIQNSTGIYNRKVDFLHQVVYNTLHEFIESTALHNNSNNSKSKKGSRGADDVKNSNGSGDSSIDEFRNFDSEMEFLLLDDVLPIDRSDGKRKINLRQEEENDDYGNALDVTMATASGTAATGLLDTTMTTTGRPSNNPVSTPEVTLLSLGGVLSASVMDQSGSFAINRESMGKSPPSALSRMLMTTLQAAGGLGGGVDGNIAGEGNLRLLAGACDIDANGALLLPGTSVSVFLRGGSGAGEVDDAGGNIARNAVGMADEGEVQIFPEGLSPTRGEGGDSFGVENSFTDGGVVDFGGDEFDNNEDDGADGMGFELNDGNGVNALDASQEEGHETAQTEMDEDKPAPRKKKENDPWALLDPHEPSNDKPQPLRIGVTFRLPPGLSEDDRPSALVNGSRTRAKGAKKKTDLSMNHHDRQTLNEIHAPPFIADITFETTLRVDIEGNDEENDKTAGSIVPNSDHYLNLLKSKDLIFGQEFAYVAKAHAKQRKALKRQRQLDQNQGISDAISSTGVNANQNLADPYNHDNENDNDGGEFDFGDADDDSYGNNEALEQSHGTQPLHRSNVDFNAIDDVFATARFEDNDRGYDDDFGTSQQTFEELCQAHLRKFSKTAEVYAAETQLTKRVGIWQAGLAPILEEQEHRAEFDIHSCGRQILQTLEDNLLTRKRTSTGQKKLEKSSPNKAPNVVNFEAISNGLEDYEVCRKFLATLMLCNCGNIAIYDGDNDGEGLVIADSIQIELLDSKFEAPMEAFLAPSAAAVSEAKVVNLDDKENILPTCLADSTEDEDVSSFDE
mmetsp:Transcript_21405/g.44920  ORF Transcript_21405/g.44920 Transcript_21405/m.44920 type:complete len:893 (-) Transcript_21405:98-2776(-)